MAMGRPARAAIYQRLTDAIDDLNRRLGGLPAPAEAEGIWVDLWHQEAHHSTAIEGNTLVLNQVRKLLDQGLAVGAKELREYMEVQGYADAAKWVYRQARNPEGWAGDGLLTLREVRETHYRVMAPVWGVAPHPDANDNESPGNFREHEIQPFPGGMTPPSWVDVAPQMQQWLVFVASVPTDTSRPFPELLAELHSRFERIHPFLDGNGRTGRLLLNLVLIRLGYPPAIIFKRDRAKYLKALDRADGEDYGPLAELIARGVTDNLHRFVVPAVAGPARLVPLTSLATRELSVVALRAAAERGRLRAEKQSDGSWRSSQQWVAEYVASRHQRAPRGS
jgi:Fic family protein